MTTEKKLPIQIFSMHYNKLTVDFYYPKVYGLSDVYVQQRINSELYNLMIKVTKAVIQPELVTYVTGFYEIKNNQRQVLSITVNAMGDFHGAHPVTVVKSANIDVKTGKNYELHQLFKPDSGYIKKLSDMIYAQIKERDIPLLDGFKGIRPDQDYYIADKSLIIYFQQYEISPYVAGLPYFVIPIYDIGDMILPNSILNRMLMWL